MNPEKKYGMIVELDQDGRVTNSWQSPDGTFEDFSEGYLHTDGYIYLGSPYNTYIARVKYDSWPLNAVDKLNITTNKTENENEKNLKAIIAFYFP